MMRRRRKTSARSASSDSSCDVDGGGGGNGGVYASGSLEFISMGEIPARVRQRFAVKPSLFLQGLGLN